MRWDQPKHPNCDITHYTISISGGIQGKVTMPPNKTEYSFETIVDLNEESLYGVTSIIPSGNISIRTFQFKISADSRTENITGVPSFFEASLNKLLNDKYKDNNENSITKLSFRFLPKILHYNDNDNLIEVIDLDAQKVILKSNVLGSSSTTGRNTGNIEIRYTITTCTTYLYLEL